MKYTHHNRFRNEEVVLEDEVEEVRREEETPSGKVGT